ncbi:alpha-1,3-arabinosyltransferase XAT3-like [Phragmites australis]|uniref:alpha-1,3-arabinosyltransferase XAT3-like n=1 Tax=Phragmites australis TaxID=29695 RepID=UPI002D79A945|nr:alpha-1,3-arabinosyltransferase XAT3-like [Phragmites australis]XP_062201999.1 alpha-1,3-arabinosyltransferase XAT3-like [Phragmites australis]XP_062202045.1 alpha-1,3-arabinosyltransferase XAT3-like [Phragmites australis]
MACEKKIISNFTVKVGSVLLAVCILVPISLVTMFRHYAVPLQTLSLLFSVGSSSLVMSEKEKIGSRHSGRNQGPVFCDFSSPRSDVCELKGDVRVLPNATVLLLHHSARRQSWRMKPHARKNDGHALAHVTEVTVASSHPTDRAAPRCTAKDAAPAPAVIFSVGGYAGNMFHDLTDVLVPLFITTRQFGGDVHLLVSDAQPWWVDKFRPLLRGFSRHGVVDLDRERSGVLCYPHVIVGLEFHKEMSVDAARTAGEYSMADFGHLARRSYGLTRDMAIRLHGRDGNHSAHPRLLIISRKATRTFTNVGAITRTATTLGYEVVVGEAERHADLPSFARLVNSCDVLVGVHGAGLANLVFLPAGAVVVQVVPLGGLDAMAAEDFGASARDMGLGYVHYGIAVEESTLARRYPRDHRVLRDPAAVRREGWMALRSVYLVGQNVTIDVHRFRGALRRAMELLP